MCAATSCVHPSRRSAVNDGLPFSVYPRGLRSSFFQSFRSDGVEFTSTCDPHRRLSATCRVFSSVSVSFCHPLELLLIDERAVPFHLHDARNERGL